MNPNPPSRLSALHVAPGDGQCESLVLALQAVLRACGRDVDYDELAAATGVAFMTTRAVGEPDPRRWPAHGRHAFLVPAARKYGLELRDLHPPGAAPLPRTPPEFAGHFRDSYLPFVAGAVARGEPVLAWMGWPSPHELKWGIITDIDAASGRCLGCTAGLTEPRVPLAGPPVQVYVVQGGAAGDPSPRDLLQAALERAAVILDNRLDPSFGVVTGPPAMLDWHTALSDALGRVPGAPDPAAFHPLLARVYLSGRGAAVRFLERFRVHGAPARPAALDACIAAYRQAVAGLEPACDPRGVSAALDSKSARQELLEALSQAIECERRAAEALR